MTPRRGSGGDQTTRPGLTVVRPGGVLVSIVQAAFDPVF
jgi:hypothetical protein